jgi:hypothetical protein
MPLQDLAVGLGSKKQKKEPLSISWFDKFKSNADSSGGNGSAYKNPEGSDTKDSDSVTVPLPSVIFDDDDTPDIYDGPEFTFTPEIYTAAQQSANRAALYYTPDEALQEAYEADMSGKGSDEPDQTGSFGVPGITVKDVTGTDAGALSNPQPLYDMADEFANPSITTTELPSADQEASLMDALMEGQPTKGLMSRPSSFTGAGVDVASNMPDWMAELSAAETAQALIDIREGRMDAETGQRIQSEEDIKRSSSPRPQLRPEGFMAKVGDFDASKYNLNTGMNPAITMDAAYQNVGTKPGQVNPNAQENLEKMLQNQYSTLMSNLDFDLTINDAIVKPGSTRIPNPAKGKKGTPGSRHFHGDALDISVRGLSTDQLNSLLEQSYKAGFRGFGFGNNILHLDLNGGKEKVRTWNYGNEYWGGNKSYPVSDVMSRVRKGIK